MPAESPSAERRPPLPPGWYDDPRDRFDLRYHNGFVWTNDVATDGERFVDPFHPPTPAPPSPTNQHDTGPSRPEGTAAMVLGICALAIAWIPFVVVAGVVAGVLALALGVRARRRARRDGLDGGRAVVALVTGSIALLCAVVGAVLTVSVLRAIDRFDHPASHTALVDDCSVAVDDDGVSTWSATVSITNDDDVRASFSIEVFVSIDADGEGVDGSDVELTEVDRLAPGATEQVELRGRRVVTGAPTCRVVVHGPLPFGLDLRS